MLPLNILIKIHSLVFVVRYKQVYINTCWYDEFCEKFKYMIRYTSFCRHL